MKFTADLPDPARIAPSAGIFMVGTDESVVLRGRRHERNPTIVATTAPVLSAILPRIRGRQTWMMF